MNKFEVGDKVKVYESRYKEGSGRGKVREIDENGELWVQGEFGSGWFHPKQCRKLMKKKKNPGDTATFNIDKINEIVGKYHSQTDELIHKISFTIAQNEILKTEKILELEKRIGDLETKFSTTSLFSDNLVSRMVVQNNERLSLLEQKIKDFEIWKNVLKKENHDISEPDRDS